VYLKIAVFIMIVGLLSACGSQPTDTSAAQPTETVASVTEAPTQPALSTDTAAPTDTAAVTQSAAQGVTVSYANDVLPIIESRCVNCHGGDRTEEGLSLKTYDNLMAGSEHGSVITPGNAVDSKLVKLIVSQKMPKRGPKLTPPQVQLITDWVNQGALNN
jgi:uncharacterized membrane protein